MRKIFKSLFALFFALTSFTSLYSQESFFKETTEDKLAGLVGPRIIIPQKYKTFTIDSYNLGAFFQSLPLETNVANRNQAPVINLPMPDGRMAKFHVWKSPVMEPGLAAKYPEIQTFAGQGIDDPYATVRFDYNPYFGFSAQVLSVNGRVFIDPYAKGEINHCISYYTKDYVRENSLRCEVMDTDIPPFDVNTANKELAGPCRGTELYTYRLALACTGEYAVKVCSPSAATVPLTLSKMVTSVNRVDGVYETELAIRLLLIANTDQLIYLDGNADPYTNNNGTTMLTENQNNINVIIGSANYDIGHVFSTGGGGIAGLGVVCNPTQKARGVTGSPNPVGDDFDIDFVAHEMGHQFGGTHTFNSTSGNCGGGNRTASAAYEVGSGTTIMAYAGICGTTNNIQPHSDPFFHTISFDQISSFLQAGGSCKSILSIVNTLPQITAMNNNNANIPTQTPFTLSGAATDADGDALTYSWEEWDLGSASDWNDGANTTDAPLFKSRVPKITGERTFPDIEVIRQNYPVNPPAVMGGLKGEVLPQVGRTMNFRLTVRDGHGGVVTGGDGCQSGFTNTFQVNVIDGTGPFEVTYPNLTGITMAGGTANTVTWSVAGTSAAPISCTNVKISLSTDGGLTYPTVLIASTPNDGSESVVLPANPTTITTARIKVEAADNIFFDISNNNFTITAAAAGFTFSNPAAATAACPAPATMGITLGTSAVGVFSNPITLSATAGIPAGTTVTFGTNPVTPGNSSVVTLNNSNTLAAGSYVVTITGTATGAATQTRDLTFTIQAGSGPVINTQPQAQTVCVGTNALFSVVSPGALSYQWQVSTNGGGSFSNISGATSSTYTATSVTAGMNNNQYRAIVTGQCNTTTSNAALLTVQTAPAITAQPQNATLCIGSNATFNVTANGTGISYQWQVSTNGGGSFSNIGGATTNSYTGNSITTGMNNNQYRVVITGTCTPAATSGIATLTVISPVTVTTNPADITICETGNVSFTAAGSGSGVLYQWQVSTNGGASYSDINGATAATLNVNAVTAAMNNNRYQALMWNATCTTPAVTTGAILTVNARPTVTISANAGTQLQPGDTTRIIANISAPGFDISWFKDNALLNGVNGTSYLIDVTGIGSYQVKIVNPTTGCNNESNILPITAQASERLFIFPSPNDGQFTVSYYNSAGANTQQTIAVYDSHGALVYSAKMPVTGQYTLHQINMRGKATGVYVVVVGDASGKKLAQEKVVISN